MPLFLAKENRGIIHVTPQQKKEMNVLLRCCSLGCCVQHGELAIR